MNSTPEQIREEQTRVGRTLSVKEGYNRPPGGDRRSSGYGGKRTGGGDRKPATAKGHDAILKGAQDAGAIISVVMASDGTNLSGKLIARDKFTISIQTHAGIVETIYKHAIERFSVIASQVQ